MSKILREGEVGDYQRWQVPRVEDAVVFSSDGKSRGPDGGGLLTAERIEQIQEQARNEAYAAGFQQGLDEAHQEMQTRAAQLETILRALAEPSEQLDEQVEQELATLAMVVARQLVRREIRTDPGQIIAVVREAMAILPSAARDIELRLHPEDASLVREVLRLSEGERPWKIVEDPVLTRGGCRLVSDVAQVDASLESRLNAVVAAVMGGERDQDCTR
jgi:flagellar assembly protein FliH